MKELGSLSTSPDLDAAAKAFESASDQFETNLFGQLVAASRLAKQVGFCSDQSISQTDMPPVTPTRSPPKDQPPTSSQGPQLLERAWSRVRLSASGLLRRLPRQAFCVQDLSAPAVSTPSLEPCFTESPDRSPSSAEKCLVFSPAIAPPPPPQPTLAGIVARALSRGAATEEATRVDDSQPPPFPGSPPPKARAFPSPPPGKPPMPRQPKQRYLLPPRSPMRSTKAVAAQEAAVAAAADIPTVTEIRVVEGPDGQPQEIRVHLPTGFPGRLPAGFSVPAKRVPVDFTSLASQIEDLRAPAVATPLRAGSRLRAGSHLSALFAEAATTLPLAAVPALAAASGLSSTLRRNERLARARSAKDRELSTDWSESTASPTLAFRYPGPSTALTVEKFSLRYPGPRGI